MERQDQEMRDLDNKVRNRTVYVAVATGAAVVLVAGLMAVMSPGHKITEYSMGSDCTRDCGRFSLVGWVCLQTEQQESYCSRRCDLPGEGCPLDMECREAKDDLMTLSMAADPDASFCFRRDLFSLWSRDEPDLQRVQTAIFAPLLIEVPRR